MSGTQHSSPSRTPGSVYASSCRSWETGLWQATAWRRVLTADGTLIDQRCSAHVRGFTTSAAAERAALARASGAAQ
jgi:hypothetical protein